MGREGWSWHSGEREVQGSLYCEELRARAAILDPVLRFSFII
jgi:hypothetical protein